MRLHPFPNSKVLGRRFSGGPNCQFPIRRARFSSSIWRVSDMNSEYWRKVLNLSCSEIWNLRVRYFFVAMTELNTWIINTSEYALNEPWISFSTSSPGNCCHWEIPFVIPSCPFDEASRNSAVTAGFSLCICRQLDRV